MVSIAYPQGVCQVLFSYFHKIFLVACFCGSLDVLRTSGGSLDVLRTSGGLKDNTSCMCDTTTGVQVFTTQVQKCSSGVVKVFQTQKEDVPR